MSSHDDFDEFVKETKQNLMELEEKYDDSDTKKKLDAITKEIEKWFNEVRKFIDEHNDSEKNKEIIKKLKENTNNIIEATKAKLNDVKEDEKVQEVLTTMSTKLNDIKDSVNENETFNKVKDNISTKIDAVKNDENVKKNVKKVKKSTLKFAQKALNSIEKALNEDDDEIVVHDFNKEDDNK